MKIGDIVQILDGSEWHSLYGVAHDIINGIPRIACVTKPLEKYWVYPELEKFIKIIEINP